MNKTRSEEKRAIFWLRENSSSKKLGGEAKLRQNKIRSEKYRDNESFFYIANKVKILSILLNKISIENDLSLFSFNFT